MRERIASSHLLAPERSADLLATINYSLAHPSSLAEKRAQTQRAIREREEIKKKNS